MPLADRLNRIIQEQKLSKAEFAKRLGVTAQYVHLLTGNAKARPDSIKPVLAKLIALEFGYDEEWILHGKEPEPKISVKPNKHTCEGPLRVYGLSVREEETVVRFADGKSIKQIAEEDSVTLNTAKYYIKRAYEKMNIHSRSQLISLLDELNGTTKCD